MSKISAADKDVWDDIERRCYADQAIWALNGFWEKMEKDAEMVWTWAQKMGELDEAKGAGGCELDEFWSHKFLESLGETMTVIAMREAFRKIDADFNKHMSMLEYIMFRFDIDPHSMCTAPQGGGDAEKIAQAQKMVAEAQKAVEAMNKALAAAEKAEAENKAALAELQAQEKAFADKMASLEKISQDMSIGLVKRNKAANELEQLRAEDPLPLQRAKINQAATVRKSEKATKAAEAAVANAEAKLQEALEFLQNAKKSGGVAQGQIWWMERELKEKQKYLPSKRR